VKISRLLAAAATICAIFVLGRVLLDREHAREQDAYAELISHSALL
jgi:hypothetical protein